MKKTNMITRFILILSMILLISFTGCKAHKEADVTKKAASAEPKTKTEQPVEQSPAPVSMEDALFIGDSRTVGLSEYAGITEADFFSDVGMSVYNVRDKVVSVPTVGKLTLEELLSSKNYGKIYLMLGINEIGYKFENTMSEYTDLLNFIKEKQPDATIFIQANLHVTKSLSESDGIVNNEAIDHLNAAIAKLADGKEIFYLDANSLFDDEEGNLSTEKSADNVHILAKYYMDWGKWIIGQTTTLLREDAH